MKVKIYLKKKFIVLILFSVLIFSLASLSIANAIENKLSSTLILSTNPPEGALAIKVQPDTTYKYTISLTNNLASKAPIVLIKPRLPDPFVMSGPVVCPSGWPAGHIGNNSEGIGSVVCTEPGLDTSIPNPVSNPQYDIAYGQTGSVSFTFTTSPSKSTTDLALYIAYINSSGLMQGTWFSPVQIVIESSIIKSPTCTSWTYSDWSICTSNGNQERNVISSFPSNCIKGSGSPITRQNCSYKSPDQRCKDSYGVNSIASIGGGSCGCSTGYVWNDARNSCITPATTKLNCTADTWACGNWGSCSSSGMQSRTCSKTFDCPNVETVTPTVNQYCESGPIQEVPQDSSAISNQDTIIRATVKLICPLDNKRAIQGSGTVIDSSGLILTNKHVISGTLGCLVGFVDSSNDVPYFGNRQIADIQKISSKEDVAILKLRNPQNRKLTHIDIAKANNDFRLGITINIYGYPAIFGTNMTYTSGNFSGVDGSYLKTTAVIEHGNSGGGAYLSNGMFIGIPSAVVKGELNSLGYILSINTINAWMGNSSIAYTGNSNQNNYSRVASVLEDIDLNKLDSLEFVIPGTKEGEEITNDSDNNLNDKLKENPPVETDKDESGFSIFPILVIVSLGGGVWLVWKLMKNRQIKI